MITGNIFITSDINVVYNRPPYEKIIVINMDEDQKLSKMIPDCIEGVILLPPVEAKIAEVDGDETRYDLLYLSHLYQQQDFISAIITFLFRGGKALIYLPDEYNNTKSKLLEFMFQVYGIHIGNLEDPRNDKCFYNPKSIPFWLNIMYTRNLISYLEWLKYMPLDAYTPDGVLGGSRDAFMKAVYDLNPYTDTMEKKIALVREFHVKIHKNPNLRPAIRGL